MTETNEETYEAITVEADKTYVKSGHSGLFGSIECARVHDGSPYVVALKIRCDGESVEQEIRTRSGIRGAAEVLRTFADQLEARMEMLPDTVGDFR